jgi:hypothetical protein
METPDLSTARWRKSTHSGGNNGACIELANIGAIRDSKNQTGPALLAHLAGLLTAVKAGQLNRTSGTIAALTAWSTDEPVPVLRGQGERSEPHENHRLLCEGNHRG